MRRIIKDTRNLIRNDYLKRYVFKLFTGFKGFNICLDKYTVKFDILSTEVT